MPLPRKLQIVPGQSGFYHCISRCVRRAWLCGTDPLSTRNFDHRRDWMIERMRVLTQCFAVDVYAYAFMSNHYHLVLHVDPKRLDEVDDDEIVRRWKTLWNWRDPHREIDVPPRVSEETLTKWRQRLGDVSWFMKMLNEPLARLANAEDDCKGHFWESRFKSIPLLDDAALVACMAYVDLNPIKAGVAESPEDSDFTSIQQRLRDVGVMEGDGGQAAIPNVQLVPAVGQRHANATSLKLPQYVRLLRETAVSLEKREPIADSTILERLNIKATGWPRAALEFLTLFRSAAGGNLAYTAFMNRTGRRRRQDGSGIDTVFTTI